MAFHFPNCRLVFFLFAIVHLNYAKGNMGELQKPPTKSDDRIGLIQNDLLKVQTDIVALNTALASGDLSEDLKARLSTLEGQFEGLKQQLGDERRESSLADGKYDSAIATLTVFYNSLETQLKTLQTTMEKKAQDDARRQLPIEVAREIRSHRFEQAEALLLKMANDQAEIERIPSIVHDVYANSQGNIDILMDFAKSMKSIYLTSYFLTALRYEMKANGHHDPYKLMALCRAITLEVLIQPNASDDVKSKAVRVVADAFADIANTATETLKTAVYADKYEKNVEVENLAKALSDFSPQVSDVVMQRIVNETYPAVSAVKLADNMYSNKYIAQCVSGLVAVFRKLDSQGNLNDKAVLNIGYYLKRLMEMPNYENIDEKKQADVKSVIDRMPTCAKNLFFAKSVCIWNRGKSEYLYAASSQYNWNRDRRSIFSWTTGEKLDEGTWYAERYDSDDYIYFKNKVHNNEYMYAAGVDPYDKNNRYVLTWIDGGGGIVKDKAAWEVELYGDYCYLKNKNYDEYLYLSGKMYSDKRRYVFTWMPGTSHRQSMYQWQIRDCN